MKTLIVTVESTGKQLGTVTWDGTRIASDASVASEMIEARRRRGLPEAQIWAQLDGWSNGYLSMRGTDDTPTLDPQQRDRTLQLATRAAGHDVTPGHDQLHHYWTRGEGLAKWRTSPHPWTTLRDHLLKYVNPHQAVLMASKWFEEVFGYTAGSDLHRLDSGKPPRGKVVGPG